MIFYVQEKNLMATLQKSRRIQGVVATPRVL